MLAWKSAVYFSYKTGKRWTWCMFLHTFSELLTDVSVYGRKIYIGQHCLLEIFILLKEIKTN